jgi:predicted hydrocarbon binding protein
MLNDIKTHIPIYLEPMKDYISELSDEQWQALRENIRVVACQISVNAFLDVADSNSVINSTRPYFIMSGKAFAINIINLFHIEGDDIDKMGDCCLIFHKISDHDMNEIERTKDKIVCVGGTKCHWRDNPKEMCITHGAIFLNAVCEAINPEYECKFTHMITKGDPFCSWVIEKKKK